MTMKEPFEIGSRLLPSLKIGDGHVSLEFVTKVGCGRGLWRWYVDIPAGEFSGTDLRSRKDTQDTFAALLDFLDACGESYRYWLSKGKGGDPPENLGLFPLPVAEWAYANADEITALLLEIEETPFLIVE